MIATSGATGKVTGYAALAHGHQLVPFEYDPPELDEHDIRPKTELMPMTKVNDALQRVMQDKARHRIVLVNLREV